MQKKNNPSLNFHFAPRQDPRMPSMNSNNPIGMTQLGELKSNDLRGKTIFIRCDFNVPLRSTAKGQIGRAHV